MSTASSIELAARSMERLKQGTLTPSPLVLSQHTLPRYRLDTILFLFSLDFQRMVHFDSHPAA